MTLKKYEFDGLTGEEVLRDMTTEEVADYNSYVAKVAAYKEAEAKIETDKAAAKVKLEALGLTPDDLKALGL
jgi:hypothetical protein